MITSIRFKNFKALRDATLPLGPFTLIVGPNGSGKSTAMEAFDFVLQRSTQHFGRLISADLRGSKDAVLLVRINWRENSKDLPIEVRIQKHGNFFR